MIQSSTLFFLIESLADLVANKIQSTIADNERIHDFLDRIKRELELMKAFLEDAEEERFRSKRMDAWVGHVKEAAYQVEDFIDEFLALVHSRSGGGLLGFGHNVRHYFEDMETARSIAADAEKVRNRIIDISKLRNSLGFRGTSGEAAAEKVRNGIVGASQMRNSLEFRGTSGEGPSWRDELPGKNLSSSDEGEIVLGVDRSKGKLMQWLTPTSAVNERQRRRRVVSVWGMGGLGKTTLVSQVYHHPTVKRGFQALVWLSVTQSYDIASLLRSMVHDLQAGAALKGQGPEGGDLLNTHTLTSKLYELLREKRYFIVLDDVWDGPVCRQLFGCIPSNNNGSRILVTTRDQNVASLVSENGCVLDVSPLSDTDARLLFFHKAAFENAACPPELDRSAQMIINKCSGLPLAIVAIGRMMAGVLRTDAALTNMLQRLEWELPNRTVLKDMAKGLILSYKRLPYHLQRCFLYCSMFKEGHPIKTKWLVRMWITEGFVIGDANVDMTMEEIGVCYVEELTSRSLLQVVKKDAAGRPKVCRVHDIMRDLALSASKGENLCVRTMNQLANPGAISNCLRLSIVKSLAVQAELPLSHIRSLLVFSSDPSLVPSIRTICKSLKFLRVLDLRGAPIRKVPSSVFHLFNLRYLSLRGTSVSNIPRTVENLYNLQTLDLWKSKVTNLPRSIIKLTRLRHLYKEDISADELTYMNIGHMLRGQGAPSGVTDLKELHTLTTIRASQRALVELESMTQLRDLGVTDLHAIDEPELCNSINRMGRLSRLSIRTSDEQLKLPVQPSSIFMLDGLSPPPTNLRKLILNLRMQRVPVWFSSLNNLTHLYLFNSWLPEIETPIPSLGRLANLVLLALDDDAYQGRSLHFVTGDFRMLQTLVLSNLRGMFELIMEDGALPNLQVMYLWHLRNLRAAKGIQYINWMQALHLRGVPINPSDLQLSPGVKLIMNS